VAVFYLYTEKKTWKRLIAKLSLLFLKIVIAESNGDARILTGYSEVAVPTHAQYKFAPKTAQND